MTIEDYDTMLEKQNNVCAICYKMNKNGKRFIIDHCHQTGRVRGLICHNCNVGIGLLGEDRTILSSAINYLNKE